MRYKVILTVFLFTEGEGGQDESTIQGLIDNNTSRPRKMMSYSMQTAKHDNEWHTKIRLITKYR
jgi:hypothetical protein